MKKLFIFIVFPVLLAGCKTANWSVTYDQFTVTYTEAQTVLDEGVKE